VIDLDEIRKRVAVLAAAAEAELRAKGATDADVSEDVFKVMVARKITDQLRAELGPDRYKEIYKEAWDNFVETASPGRLRELAKLERKANENGAACYLELVADYREEVGEP
jgi:hypothetical protein